MERSTGRFSWLPSDARIGRRRQRRCRPIGRAPQPSALTHVVLQPRRRARRGDNDAPTGHQCLRVQAPRQRTAERTVGPDHSLHRCRMQRRGRQATAPCGVFEHRRPQRAQLGGHRSIGGAGHGGWDCIWLGRRWHRATGQNTAGAHHGRRQQWQHQAIKHSHALHCGGARCGKGRRAERTLTPRRHTTDVSQAQMRVLRGKNALHLLFRAVPFAPQGDCEK